MPDRPSLAGAELVDLRFERPDLEFWLEGVRWLGLVFAGPMRLEGVRHAASREPRSAPDAFPLRAPMSIRRSVWGEDQLQLECFQPTGPGDADEPTYLIGFTRVTHALRPSLSGSLRAWTGFYPGPGDQIRQYAGDPSVAVAALNGAAGGMR